MQGLILQIIKLLEHQENIPYYFHLNSFSFILVLGSLKIWLMCITSAPSRIRPGLFSAAWPLQCFSQSTTMPSHGWWKSSALAFSDCCQVILPDSDKIAGKMLDCFDSERIFINARVWIFWPPVQKSSVCCIYSTFAPHKLDNKKAK